MTRPHAPTIQRCPTCKRRMTRSTPANRRYFALLNAIAESVKVGNPSKLFSSDVWHLYFKSLYLGATDHNLPSGKVISIPHSTADLDVEAFNDYMTKVEVWANERNVYLEDREES